MGYSRQVTVYGDPFICCTDECYRYASVMFRNVDAEGQTDAVILCKRCYASWRRAYRQAEQDTEVTVRFDGRDYDDPEDKVSV